VTGDKDWRRSSGEPDPRHSALRDRPPSAGRGPAALDAAAILASIGEVPYEWEIESDALTWGPNTTSVLMISDVSAISTGRGYAALLDPNNTETRYDAVMHSGARDDGKGVFYQITYALRPRPDAPKVLWVEDTGRWFARLDGRPQRAHGVIRVINERHAHEERLSYLSHFDALTGEMNRWHLTETLREALDRADQRGASCSFLIIAIDNLWRVNDAYGFAVGDEVIAAVGRRLRASIRGRDSLGRFSGNKFGIILRDCGADDMAVAAERLLAAVRGSVVQTGSGPVAVTVSIGGVTAPRHALNVQEVLTRAQEALFSARTKRAGSFLAYRPSVEQEVRRQESIRMTDEIIAALNERRLLAAYEPVVATHSRAPAFYECLMRLTRADGAILDAGNVVPIAERLGLIRFIDHRMLELVAATLAANPRLELSINVSPASAVDPDWWAALAAHARANPGLGARLIIEITEMAAIQDVDETRRFIRRARDLGCRVAIDDFGAGYTSFRNLSRLGVDMVKIDGAFVHNLTRSGDDRAFVRALIELARALGLSTVAEWVKDEATAAILAEWGCDYLQGELAGAAMMAPSVATDIPPARIA
jgi:diguanylate cyclase (GGDEF)-like protein